MDCTGDEEPEIPRYHGLTDYNKRQLLHVRREVDDGSRRLACSPETKVCGDIASRALQTGVRPITFYPLLARLHGDLRLHSYAPTTQYALPILSAYPSKPTKLDANAAILREWPDVLSGNQPGLSSKRTMLTAEKPETGGVLDK